MTSPCFWEFDDTAEFVWVLYLCSACALAKMRVPGCGSAWISQEFAFPTVASQSIWWVLAGVWVGRGPHQVGLSSLPPAVPLPVGQC